MFAKVHLSRVRNRYPKLILRQRQQYLNSPLLIFKALIRVFPLLGFHNVGILFAPVDAILVQRAQYSVLLVDGVEERSDMIHPARLTPASSTECPCFAIFRRDRTNTVGSFRSQFAIERLMLADRAFSLESHVVKLTPMWDGFAIELGFDGVLASGCHASTSGPSLLESATALKN